MNSYHEMDGLLKIKKRKGDHESEKRKTKPQMVSLSSESSAASFDTPPAEPKFDVDLSADGNISSSTPEFSIHLGRGYVLTMKEYQSSKYYCFSRETNNRISNRFNLPISLKDNLKQAINMAADHASKYS